MKLMSGKTKKKKTLIFIHAHVSRYIRTDVRLHVSFIDLRCFYNYIVQAFKIASKYLFKLILESKLPFVAGIMLCPLINLRIELFPAITL
jgi:hypothetical protein